jgi:hypothetical protein
MAGVIQENSKALAPHGILTSITSNKNGVGDLPRQHGLVSIGVSSENLSSMHITRIIDNIAKDSRGQERLQWQMA